MIEFGTAGIRGPVPETVDHRVAIAVGQTLPAVLEHPSDEVVVGRDARTTGPSLMAGLIAGLTTAGATCRKTDPVPTPVLAHASKGRLGVMVTASHNPPGDNGIKVFRDGSEIRDSEEERIEQAIDTPVDEVTWRDAGSVTSMDPLPEYLNDLRGYLRRLAQDRALDTAHPLAGLRVAIDGGNGTSIEAIAPLLRSLGATISTLNANPSGFEPARSSKPTTASLDAFSHWMADADDGFDVSFGFDGDGDRVVVLDGDGSFIHEDTIVAMLARSFTSYADIERPVVITTPNASARIDDAVTEAGGAVERTKLGGLMEGIDQVNHRGDTNERVVFAAEPWKHLFPGFGEWIDAIASAGVTSLLVAEAGSLEPLISPIADPPYVKTAVACPEGRKSTVMEELASSLLSAFPDGDLEVTDTGIRITFERSEWLLIRPSGTEAVIRLYAEGQTTIEERLDSATKCVTDLVERTRGTSTS